MIITDTQLALLMFRNGAWGPGGSKKEVVKFFDEAYAVMMGESGGDPNAKNSNTSASGLYQIMVSVHRDKIDKAIRKLSPESGQTPTIFDPEVNIEVARMVWNEAGGSWSPWEAYTKKNQAYRQNKGHGEAMYMYLDTMTQAQMMSAYQKLAALVNPIAVATRDFKADPWSSIQGFAKDAGVVVGVFVLALVILIAGLYMLLNSTKAGSSVISTAKVAATKGIIK
jgi:hypothetical protein